MEVSLSGNRPPVPTGPVADLASGVAGGGPDGTEGVGTRSDGRQQAWRVRSGSGFKPDPTLHYFME